MRFNRRSAAAFASAPASETTVRCGCSRLIASTSGNRPPAPAVACQKLIGFLRPLAAGPVDRQPVRSRIAPGIKERLDRTPSGFDTIGALKQDRVADHAIVDQCLIT